ncbi:hypothetical protein [Kineococcus sp. SYSU DK001]|uniref:hypothetical protein n=1 Tax=Kineococcus sp. SYSU DK001 TaxID=3383122 RepID=UPI003D7EBF07
MPQVTTTPGSHPLQRSGSGRTLYAAGLAVDLAGMLLLVLVLPGVVPAPEPLRYWSVFAAFALQLLGGRLRARAWWHVPLRGAQPVPDRVDLAFWSLHAAAIVTSAVLQVAGDSHPGSPALPLWALVAAGVLLAALPTVDRPAPEPPADWWTRGVPALTAAGIVLVLGVARGVFALGTATAVAAACALLVAASRSPAHRRR